jgi:glucose-1-phosphate cytidylyltransferase
MKTVILAGGLGTRLSEETADKPKPMVEIGGRPMLWHLLTFYAGHGHREFVIACGYRGEVIKQYFYDMSVHAADWTVDLRSGHREMVNQVAPDWRVHVVDTGRDTMTGGRLHRLRAMLHGETFMCTYGDGLSDVDVTALLAFHRAHGKLATVTAVHPPARFGAMTLDGSSVTQFSEKPQASEGWINGGFFVFEPGVLDYLDGDTVSLERGPLDRLAADGQLCAYRHEGFWQPMDTLREKAVLEERWQRGDAPWLPASHDAPR